MPTSWCPASIVLNDTDAGASAMLLTLFQCRPPSIVLKICPLLLTVHTTPFLTVESEKSAMDAPAPPPRPPPAGAAGAAGAPPRAPAGGRGRGRRGRAARNERLAFRRRQVGAERRPCLRAVARDEQALIPDVHRRRLERGVEALPEIARRAVLRRVGAEIRRDVPPLPGRHVDLDEGAPALPRAVSDAVEDLRVERIGRDRAELGRGERRRVEDVDLPEVAAAARHDRAGVLLGPHHPVRIARVGGHVVDLPDRLVVPGTPRLSAVERHARALIGADAACAGRSSDRSTCSGSLRRPGRP